MHQSLVDRYRAKRVLGAGRVSTVYEAVDLRSEKPIALKIFSPQWFPSEGSHDFLHSQLSKRLSLQHTGIVEIYDVLSLEVSGGSKTVGCSMELVEGMTLADRIARLHREPLSVREILTLLVQVVDALEFLHSNGIALKDFNPKRFMYTSDGKIKLPGFGFISSAEWTKNISHLSRFPGIDYRYLAPELCDVEHLGNGNLKSDIYMLGILAFELGCATPPFEANRETLIQLHKTEPPAKTLIDSGLPYWYDEFVRRCLEKSPDKRISLEELRTTLLYYLESQLPALDSSPSFLPRSDVRVLFVEDNKLDQLTIARSAKQNRFPFAFKITHSVKRAKEILENGRIDVVVSDYMLPDGTALDVIKAAGHRPTVVVTGAGREDIAVMAIRAGAFDYIMKDSRNMHLRSLPDMVARAYRLHGEKNPQSIGSELPDAVRSSIDSFVTQSLDRIRLAQANVHDLKVLERNLADLKSTVEELRTLVGIGTNVPQIKPETISNEDAAANMALFETFTISEQAGTEGDPQHVPVE